MEYICLKKVFIVVIMNWSTFTGFPCPSFSQTWVLRIDKCAMHCTGKPLQATGRFHKKRRVEICSFLCGSHMFHWYFTFVYRIALNDCNYRHQCFVWNLHMLIFFLPWSNVIRQCIIKHKYFLIWNGELPVSLYNM